MTTNNNGLMSTTNSCAANAAATCEGNVASNKRRQRFSVCGLVVSCKGTTLHRSETSKAMIAFKKGTATEEDLRLLASMRCEKPKTSGWLPKLSPEEERQLAEYMNRINRL